MSEQGSQKEDLDYERQLREMNEALLVSSVRQHELADQAMKAEKAVRLSEEQFRRAIEEAPIPVIMHAEDGEVLHISREWSALTGYTIEDKGVIQNWLTKAYGFGGDEVRDAMQSFFLPSREDQGPMSSEQFEITTREGEKRVWLFSASVPGTLNDGRRFVVGTAQDVTERVRAEEALRDNQTRLAESQMRLAIELSATQQLQQVSTELIREDDPEALYEKILEAAIMIMRSQFASFQIFHPERGDGGELRLLAYRGFSSQAAESWKRIGRDSKTSCGLALLSGKRVIIPNLEASTRLAGSDSLETFLRTGIHSMQSTPLVSRTGQMLGMISTHWSQPHDPTDRDLRLLDVLSRQAADLIERARAEEALRVSEERYRSLIESIDEGFCVIEVLFDETDAPVDYRFLDVSPSFDRQTGIENAVGKTMLEIAPQHERHWFEIYGRVALTGEPLRFENRAEQLRRDYDVYAFRVGEPEERRVAVLFNDITTRKQVEENLRESEERMRLLTESFTDYAIISTNAGGIIENWNPGAENIFGYSAPEIIGMSADLIFTLEDREKGVPEKEMAIARANGRAADERWHVRKGGERFFASGVMVPLHNRGRLLGYAKIARDLTEQKRVAEQLQRSREDLEKRVAERTQELNLSNVTLREEVVERKRSEDERVALLRRIVTTQEDERRRIAREIHDQLGQRLTALRLKIAAVKDLCTDQEELCESVTRLEELGAMLDSEVSFLAWELRPSVLDDLGLAAAIENYVREWSQHFEIPAEFHATGIKRRRFERETETNLYRIAQEALNNISKHAKATKANVLLELRKKEVILIVEDNGFGFETKKLRRNRKSGHGMGLISMRERAAICGGDVEIESALGQGTTVFVRVPAKFAQNGGQNGS